MQRLVLLIFLFAGILFSCSNNKVNTSGNLTVKGQVKGLRLGTLLLKKINYDSVFSIDSIKVDGNEQFEFKTELDEPQILILELPEIKEGKILFFAAPSDTIEIHTFLENFAVNAKIKGGKQQTKWQEYKKMLQKFNDKQLDLFQAKYDALKQGKSQTADSLSKVSERLEKRRKIYQLNFVFNNKDLPVGAYVGYVDFYNNPKILDTIYKVLPQNIKKSKYGKWIQKTLVKK